MSVTTDPVTRLAGPGLRVLVVFAGTLALGSPVMARQGSIANSPHNLNPRFANSGRICWYCHTPHTGYPQVPMWNRSNEGVHYEVYETSTITSPTDQPNGMSLLCLSCHDGTVAANKTVRGQSRGSSESPRFLSGSKVLGTDLRDDHPISMVYNTNSPRLVQPVPAHLPLEGGRVQCSTCHDPHDYTFPFFLRIADEESALCRACHNIAPEWLSSAHAVSPATWDGSGMDPWPDRSEMTVQSNACANCHRAHNASSTGWLLVRGGGPDVCAPCHNGNVAQQDIWSDLAKPYAHPVEATASLHQPSETALLDPVTGISRHVSCVDCHDPHRTAIGEPLAGMQGVANDGSYPAPVFRESEVCYRCHGDSSDKPTPPVLRVASLNNIRRDLEPGSISAHPVEVPVDPTRLDDVPSLLAPWKTPGTRVMCGDCHASESATSAGGSGPGGPHGSIYPHILNRRYAMGNVSTYVRSDYRLCWQCHDPSVFESDLSFGRHSEHDDRVGCSVCHDPHGIAADSPNADPRYNRQLINFDTSIVFPRPGESIPYWIDDDTSPGQFKGRCFLVCHGADHDGRSGEG